MLNPVKSYLLSLQDHLCDCVSKEDPAGVFEEDRWTPQYGEVGITRVFKNGLVFEKAGVSFSHVNGKALPPSATKLRPHLMGCPFSVVGISVVIHPANPFVPTTHFNLRFFQVVDAEQSWWFGGGFDLTPYYPFYEDAFHWHKMALKACSPYGDTLYSAFKQQCDDYFYLKHRNESRGIGGLFYDDFCEGGFDHSFALTRNVGSHFEKAYFPIVSRRKKMPYTESQRAFQLYRRGRYVEFNLIYDRGTLFGLQSGGRTESILMSLPPNVNWTYNWSPNKNTHESLLYEVFLKPQDWIGLAEDRQKKPSDNQASLQVASKV